LVNILLIYIHYICSCATNTNAIANAGLRVRWNIGNLFIHFPKNRER